VNTPSQEDLLGYVLGALEAQEQSDVQQYIDENPESEETLLELRNAMAPLDALDAFPRGRPGLARRACELVAGMDSSPSPELASVESEPATPGSVFRVGKLADRLEHPTSWSRMDLLAGVAFLAILGGILFPAISWSRFNSRVSACQNNMTHVGMAMLRYSDLHSQPKSQIPGRASPIAAISFFAPALLESGLVEKESDFRCAGLVGEEPRIPTKAQMANATGPQLAELYRNMGGHFGYALGYLDEKSKAWKALQNDGSSHVVWIADRPSSELQGRKSNNHQGHGQNVFFGDGRIAFVKSHTIGDDAIYENDMGIVGPGLGARDNVIAPSHVTPMVFEIVKPIEVIE